MMTKNLTDGTFSSVARYFSDNDHLTLVITSRSHAYAEARYAGRCKLTGLQIVRGNALRKIEGWTRGGRAFSVWTTNDIYGLLLRIGTFNADAFLVEGTGLTRCSDGWVDAVSERVEKMGEGDRLTIVRPTQFGQGYAAVEWRRDGDGYRSNEKGSARRTKAQMIAAFRRNRSASLWHIG